MIHTIGDSHCWHGWLKIPGVEYHVHGPMTMFSFGQTMPPVVYEIPEDDVIIFCWGEIDCRCRVNKHEPNWKENIDMIVEGYGKAIEANTQRHKKAFVYNVVPPPRKGTVPENPGFPLLGSDSERLSYVRYMNEKLRELPWGFVDVYDDYSDEEGFLKMGLSDGHVHISDPLYLIKWIDKNL